MRDKRKVGIAIACHNDLENLKRLIPKISGVGFFIQVFDDGSTDGTNTWISSKFPDIDILTGNGTNWWGGSIAKSIERCLEVNCEYIVSINADVSITTSVIKKLVQTAELTNYKVIAALVLDEHDNSKIAWAGSYDIFRIKYFGFLGLYKYQVRPGGDINDAPKELYSTNEVHGRGVLFNSEIFSKVGNYDYENFPHYGADTDFSIRLRKANIQMFVNPNCLAFVDRLSTGTKSFSKKNTETFYKDLLQYLFNRKNGESLYITWKLSVKHLPLLFGIFKFSFLISLNILRRFVKYYNLR
jgi:GT2 family glycosyltransferase